MYITVRRVKVNNHPQPIFIVGSGRSGTTITKSCLNGFNDMGSTNFEPMIFSSANERSGLAYLVQELGDKDRVKRTITYLKSRFKFTSGSREYGFYKYVTLQGYLILLNKLESKLPSDEYKYSSNAEEINCAIREFIYELYSNVIGDKKFWIDDHIINGLFSAEIIKIIPNAKFIHCIRDGREVALSFIRKGWANASYEQSLRIWNYRVCQTRLLGEFYARNNYHEVIFNELISDFDNVLNNLCKFLDMDFNAKVGEVFSIDRAKQFELKVTEEQNKFFYALSSSLKDEFCWK